MGTATALSNQTTDVSERESFDALEARLLAGAAQRIHAFLEEAKRRGIIDDEGRRISKNLPDDMKPGAQRDFGG